MKFYFLVARGVLLLALLSTGTVARADVLISQVYGGGGNAGALYTHDFIELFNRGNTAVSLNGWSVQYSSATGSVWQTTALGNLTIQPWQYLLVQQAGSQGGTEPLPAPDVVGTISMGATSGKVALVSSTTALSDCLSFSYPGDLVGYGATANCFDGPKPAPGLANNTSAVRRVGGCYYGQSNFDDFWTATPPTPRNSASLPNVCGASISDAQAPEGDVGLSPMYFTVTLNPAAFGDADFTASTADGTAVAGVDYQALVDEPFVIGHGQTTATVTVQLIGNTTPEPCKTFTVTIASTGTMVGNATATGTILNDDGPTVEDAIFANGFEANGFECA